MKRTLLLALTSLCVSSISLAQGQTIRFAMEASYPPFEYMSEQNEIVGFDVDIANAICNAISAKCTFTHQAFDSLIPSLKFRRFDAAISGIDVTPERAEQVSFTDTYYDNSAIYITTKEKEASLQNLNGKRVGTQNGTTHQKYMSEKNPAINIAAYDSYQNAVLDLKSGRLDAVFGDTAVIAEWLKTNVDLVSLGEEITDPEYFGTGMAIAVRKNNNALLEQLNKGLQTIKDNGNYQTIYDKWFAEQK